MMKTIKKVFDAILTAITGLGVIAVAVSWIITFLSITFGLAIWTSQWFFSLI